MTALHPKVRYWIRQGIFDDLRSFDVFENRVNKIIEEKDRGDAFEIFIEGYLATQPITQRVRHWVVGGIPLDLRERFKLPKDGTGIDGIYETHDGSNVAYQVKYRQKQQLTFAEVAPFLGITEQFSDRVIFTNASTLSDKAIVRTRWVNGEVFHALSPDALNTIEAWLKQQPLPSVRATPDPNYQTQALADIKATLSKHDRANVVMACGTGKTLVSLWAAEQETPRTVLVLVPSLTLLKQTLLEWSEQTSWGERFSYICVCSDPTVDLKDDALNTDTSEMGFRVDTDPAIVRRFLERSTTDIKVVFSTYQSANVVGQGASGLPPFDLAIFDEAHKTIRGASSYAISDENIRIRKRLFLTATPRHIDIHHRDKEGEFRFYSMDDQTIYGPRAHTLSFGAAANRGVICRYKVIIALIDKEMVDDFTRKQGITLVDKDEIGAKWMANLIAVQKAIEEVGASKIISFHSRVRLAQEFASKEPRGIAFHLPEYSVRHVNGGQSSRDRSEIIELFRNAPKGLLTNARCLTEGINISAVDMVAFIDPRQSRTDITQAVGRAMRKPRGPTTKTVGYVVVPVFAGMGDEDSLEEAIKSEKFEAVVDVLNALQEHDEELVDIIRELKERKGAGEPFNPRRLDDKVEVIGPRVDLDRLTTSICVEIADGIGSSWDEWFGVLTRFKAREGHCRVPQGHMENARKLGRWASNQRSTRRLMPVERKRRLDAIGFEWGALDSVWEEGFAALETFKAREGHCLVPTRHVEGTFALGQWVSTQRNVRGAMPLEREERLDEINFVWDVLDSDWEQGFAALNVFKTREGHCLVRQTHVEANVKLGQWVAVQRKRKLAVASERKRRLDEIGFVWDALDRAWELGFAALTTFKAREGHCRVPTGYVEGEIKLGTWVRVQRMSKYNLTAERRQRLDGIGFAWEVNEDVWKDTLAALMKYSAREGHCRVPEGHIEGTFKFGNRLHRLRRDKDALPPERRQQLDALEFVWDPLDSGWEQGFAALTTFKAREGHAAVPQGHIESNFKLGFWVSNQRSTKEKMTTERKQRLDEIGFVWDAVQIYWETGFGALSEFRAREGHCLVPRNAVIGTVKLGQWVASQRSKRDTMPTERKQRLDALGFVWRVKPQQESRRASMSGND